MVGSARADLLSSRVRRQIVEAVRAAPGRLAAADLAAMTDLHVTTVRFHLEQLEQAGVLVAHRQHRATVGRPRNVYSPAADATPVNDTAYAVLTQVLASALPAGDARIPAAVAAGEAWAAGHVPASGGPGTPGGISGRAMGDEAADGAERAEVPDTAETARMPVRELVDVLAQWGYPRETVTVEENSGEAAKAGAGYHMTLSHCPMLDAARVHPDVVCGAHLGLVRGTLDRLGVPGADVTVTPMARPGQCTVDVLWREGAAASDGRAVLDLGAVRNPLG